MPILIPIIVLISIGLLCAILLSFASAFFGVKENEMTTEIRDRLPGVNCGACGYSGCDAYAKALAEGKTDKANLCIPGGDGVANDIADLLGLDVGDVVEKVAYVACNGDCRPENKKYAYDGVKSCVAVRAKYKGDTVCTFACIGYGDCVRVCPRDAICINDNNVAVVDPRKCIGCGLCVKECPNNIISLINDTSRVTVKCSNHDKGVYVKKACLKGCIACGKCQKACPHDAIHVVNNLATIDYEKCTGCGECRKVCPVKCIHEGNFICGAHFE